MKNIVYPMKRFFLCLVLFLPLWSQAQTNLETKIQSIEKKLVDLKKEEQQLYTSLEALKLSKIQEDMRTWGLPEGNTPGEIIQHAALTLSYSEKHEQAQWVAHVILPDVKRGNFSRSNDFRPDPLVKNGSAIEQDYFLKTLQEDSTYVYDGYGYDRGHLAPSADFRWSQKALSESYFYSNMAPQVPQLNRERWAELENALRAYVIRNNHPLFVVTGGVLEEGLPVIQRSINRVSIPRLFYKVVYDPIAKASIGFILPNRQCSYPLSSYSCTVDSVEALTGINFFSRIREAEETSFHLNTWLGPREQDDVRPLAAYTLPKNHFNTVQARIYVGSGELVNICGKVVSTKRSGKGNIFLNLDKGFPNQIFTVSIFKDNTNNFSYAPEAHLKGKTICVRGKVSDFNGTPSMIVSNEKDIEIWENE